MLLAECCLDDERKKESLCKLGILRSSLYQIVDRSVASNKKGKNI